MEGLVVLHCLMCLVPIISLASSAVFTRCLLKGCSPYIYMSHCIILYRCNFLFFFHHCVVEDKISKQANIAKQYEANTKQTNTHLNGAYDVQLYDRLT